MTCPHHSDYSPASGRPTSLATDTGIEGVTYDPGNLDCLKCWQVYAEHLEQKLADHTKRWGKLLGEAKADLERYGGHTADCYIIRFSSSHPNEAIKDCDCGFDKVKGGGGGCT